MTIWKFPVPITDRFTLNMPAGAQPLSVQAQHTDVCMWALVDPSKPTVSRAFRVFGTGHPVDLAGGSQTGTFVDTFQVRGGDLVFHLFDYGDDVAPISTARVIRPWARRWKYKPIVTPE